MAQNPAPLLNLPWLDLFVDGDSHPRRFDCPEAVRAYLSKVERLGEEGISALLEVGKVAPPITRRRYHLTPLGAGRVGSE